MTRTASTPRRNLEILGRPEGGAGGTGPPVVPPAGSAKARRDVVSTLHQLIDTLIELDNSAATTIEHSPALHLPLLLNAVEAGRMLSISRAKVLELAARGQVPSLKVGGSVRIPRDALVAWIAEWTDSIRTSRSSRVPEWTRIDRSAER